MADKLNSGEPVGKLTQGQWDAFVSAAAQATTADTSAKRRTQFQSQLESRLLGAVNYTMLMTIVIWKLDGGGAGFSNSSKNSSCVMSSVVAYENYSFVAWIVGPE
ncbi:MAG: hypothetical protein AAF639_36740 [Chloroflexota bacterium]